MIGRINQGVGMSSQTRSRAACAISRHGKWAGIVGRLSFTKDETRFVLLTNVKTQPCAA
jgi:hypothetical protein